MKKIMAAGLMTLTLAGPAGACEWWDAECRQRPLTQEELAELPPEPKQEDFPDIGEYLDAAVAWEERALAVRKKTNAEKGAALLAELEQIVEEANTPPPPPPFWKRLGRAVLMGLAAGAASSRPPQSLPAPPPQPSPFLTGPSYAERYEAESDRAMEEYWARQADDRARAQALEQSLQATQERRRAAHELFGGGDRPLGYGSWGEKQDSRLDEALGDLRGSQAVLPDTTVYPCPFIRRNSRAYQACQQDWQANPPDQSWRFMR